MCAIVFFPAH